MIAIYKRELKSYLTSMIGYLFLFFILLITGLYFTAYQLTSAYPKFEYTMSSIIFVFLVAVPLITMRVLAEERKQKTDQILLTSPVSISGIVWGKYLALLTLFGFAILIICIYPLIISMYGNVSFASCYNGILGFFLLGAAVLAIGVYISALTESQVISAVLSFVIIFSFYVITGISSFFSETSLSTCIAIAVLILAFSLLTYNMIHSFLISIITVLVAEMALVITYFVNSSFFEGGIQKILSIFDISGHFENFASGILDIKSVIYYISIVVVCMFLTAQSIQKRRWN